MEGICFDLMEDIIPMLAWRDWVELQKPSVKVVSSYSENRTGNLANTHQIRYSFQPTFSSAQYGVKFHWCKINIVQPKYFFQIIQRDGKMRGVAIPTAAS
jgi:hypothetical protein